MLRYTDIACIIKFCNHIPSELQCSELTALNNVYTYANEYINVK